MGVFQPQVTQPTPEEEEEAEEEETEELGHVDTYAEYKPSKCKLLGCLSTISGSDSLFYFPYFIIFLVPFIHF